MQRFCNYCGLEINDDDKYCGNCGNEIKEEIDIEPIINEDIHNGKLGKLVEYVNPDEKILYAGTPNATCEILDCIFNETFLKIVISTLFLLIIVIMISVSSKGNKEANIFIWSFFGISLLMLSVPLSEPIRSAFSIKNIAYIVTNKNIYISYGMFFMKCEIIPFEYIEETSTTQSYIDKKYDVGDIEIKFVADEQEHATFIENGTGKLAISNINEYKEVSKMIRCICDNNQRYMQNSIASNNVSHIERIV